jgi:hypothetical protein
VSLDCSPFDSVTLRTAAVSPSQVQPRSTFIVDRTQSGESMAASNNVPSGLTSIAK